MLRWGRLECSGGFLLAAAFLFYLDEAGVFPGLSWPLLSMSWAITP